MTDLPEELLQFTKLKVLFLGSNHFEVIPSFLGRMSSLYMLSFKSNRLTNVPEDSLSPSIGWLILTDNKLSSLPESIGRLSGLRKLMLANNRLPNLPASLALCKQLELVRLSRNNLDEFPSWLFNMPRLSWLALSGNPASTPRDGGTTSTISNTISYSELIVGEVIGQGASGVVHRVELSHPLFTYDISRFEGLALKLFKGDCSSDGHPSDEVYVSGLVGAVCENILPVLGCISESAEADRNAESYVSSDITASVKYGLIFPLIPDSCTVLAGPPSFASVTRDCYEDNRAFQLPYGLQILTGLAAAGEYLHGKGVMHGDIYGHNIHVYADGRPILVDFGAATAYALFVDPSDSARRRQFESIEVRAFGCLMEEILTRSIPLGDVPSDLVDLQQRCLSELPSERPSFTELRVALSLYSQKQEVV